MRKLLLIIISLLLSLGCATGPVRNETFVNYYAAQSEYSESRSNGDGHSYINFYLTDGIPPEQVNTIALLPAGYDKVFKFDSVNFPDKKWVEMFGECIKAKLIKGYSSKYTDSMVIDTTLKWKEFVDTYSKNLKWDLIYSRLKKENKVLNQVLLDSADKLFNNLEISIISSSEIDNYMDTSEFYRDNRVKKEYEIWGGKACYDSICDSITKIVKNEFSSKGLFKIIPPPVDKFDYAYFDDDGINPWYTWYYQSSDSIPENRDTIKQKSEAIFKWLGADAYVDIDITFDNRLSIRVSPPSEFLLDKLLNKDHALVVRKQLFLNISIFGPEYNALWSADLPISRQMKWSAHIPTNKEMKNIYANEIIDYNMARENIKRALSLILSNKSGNKFQ